MLFDRDAARKVFYRLLLSEQQVEATLDALAGCVSPVPAQTIDRDTWQVDPVTGNIEYKPIYSNGANALLRPVSDSRFDTIRALHRAVNRGGWDDRVCSQCWDYENSTAEQWPCATIRALDGDV